MNRDQIQESHKLFGSIPIIDPAFIRKGWLAAAKLGSLGVSLHGFSSKAWDYSQTLGSFLASNPIQNKRIEKWSNSKNDGWPNILMGDHLAYMLRPTAKQLKDMERARVRSARSKGSSASTRKKKKPRKFSNKKYINPPVAIG